MRSMALVSAPMCYLLLVLKLANCSLLVLLVAQNWLHGLRVVWVRATHIILNAKWCVSYLRLCRQVILPLREGFACTHVFWRALKHALR